MTSHSRDTLLKLWQTYQILQNLSQLQGAPSVQMTELPPEHYLDSKLAAGVPIGGA